VAWRQRPARAPLLLGGVIALWLGGLALTYIEWVVPDGAPLRATMVQANVALRDKWDPRQRPRILERYQQLSISAPASELIIWPEAAIPAALHQIDPAYLDALREFARTRNTDVLFGVIESSDDRRHYYNSAVVVGRESGVYRKQHLVPLGEYTPLEPLLRWLMTSFDIPMSDFSPAPGPQSPLSLAGRLAGLSVCYEDAFGEEVIRSLPQASVLVNVSEDAWFGDSLAPHQRLQMARMRAREAARPMLHAANTGPSAAIDHRGNVLARSAQFRPQLLFVEVQPMRGATAYVLAGNWPVVGVLVLALVLVRYRTRRAR